MNLRHNISSGISNSLLISFIVKVECNSAVIILWDNTEKKELKIKYHIKEWDTCTTTYDILHNNSNYPTVFLLLYKSHRTDHCITVCYKWIFDSNLEFALPLTKAWLNYICSGNDNDDITFFGVLHAIRAVPPVVFQNRLNI